MPLAIARQKGRKTIALCVCTQVPLKDRFTAGQYYEFDDDIDAESVVDDHDQEIRLPERVFLESFIKCEAVTCFCPSSG